MELLVVRHAVAQDRESFARSGKDDAERPLTDDGRRRFSRAARGLVRLAGRPDLLATSRLVRAVETGELLERAFELDAAVRLDELAPEAAPEALVAWLRRQPAALVAVVGHEPHLSRLVEHLLVGRRAGFLALKKGGACLVDLGDRPEARRATLRWLLTQAQLRRIRR